MESDCSKRLTVGDIIEHLKKFPSSMEVWTTWDESGEYFPMVNPHGRKDHVALVQTKHRKAFFEVDEGEPGYTESKEVFVFEAPHL